MSVNIEVTVEDKQWFEEDNLIINDIKLVILKILPFTELAKFVTEDNLELEISILLTNDSKIKQLNKIYRGKNQPTNVLSFPASSSEQIAKPRSDFPLILGDIVLSLQTVKQQALQQNKSLKNHIYHLLVHSILHLIGYDHKSSEEADLMESLEIKILKKLDIDNPYIISE